MLQTAALLAFNGTLDLTIPAGQDHITVALVDAGNSSSANTVNLTASLTDASGNALSVTFAAPTRMRGCLSPPTLCDARG